MPSAKLLDRLREVIRLRHYSRRTEEAYVRWVIRFVRFHGLRHPEELDGSDIEAFLSHLATRRHVAASTQNQALNAIVFLYRNVLRKDVPELEEFVRAKKPRRLPVVLTKNEVARVLSHLEGTPFLVSSLLYGGGLRLMEVLRLRVKDVDFAKSQVLIRDGKGGKDRVTVMPAQLAEPLRLQIALEESARPRKDTASPERPGRPERFPLAPTAILADNSYMHHVRASSSRKA